MIIQLAVHFALLKLKDLLIRESSGSEQTKRYSSASAGHFNIASE